MRGMDKDKLRDSREVRKLHERRLRGRFMRVMKDDIMREQCLLPYLSHSGVQVNDQGSAEIWNAVQNLDSRDKERTLGVIDSAIDAYDQAQRKVHEIESRGRHVDRENMIVREVQQRIAGIATTNRGRWAKNATREELIGQMMPSLDRMAKRISHDTPNE